MIALVLSLISSLAFPAPGTLDSIPDVPEKAPICNLGKYNYAAGAITFAKQKSLPAPTTLDSAFDLLAQLVLESCDDGQIIELGDSAGGRDIPARAMKLLKKFCDEKDIKVGPIPDIAPSMQSYAKRWSCPISKLREVRKLLGQSKEGG